MNNFPGTEERLRGPAVPLVNSANWNPALHPRDSRGEFRFNGGRHHHANAHKGSNPMVKGSKGFQIALQFIIEKEVTSQKYYDEKESHPTVPPHSGVTIGIGYDLGQVSLQQFEKDWGDLLPADVMNRLRPFVGKKHLTPADLAPIKDIKIPWEAATKEFEERTLPQAINQTRSIYPQLDSLPPESQAALVSLVYNRGPRLKNTPGSHVRDSMIKIHADLKAGRLKNIGNDFHTMAVKGPSYLRKRRLDEGKLFRKGVTRK